MADGGDLKPLHLLCVLIKSSRLEHAHQRGDRRGNMGSFKGRFVFERCFSSISSNHFLYLSELKGFDTQSNRRLSPELTKSSHSSNLLHIMINTRTRNHGGRMDFHGGSVTGATAEKLSEMPRFHKRYSKGLMTMETALEMETWNHEDQHVFNTNGRFNEYYTTYKEAEIRDLTRGLAEATKVKKNIARLRDDAQTIRKRLRSSHLAMVDGTHLESDYEVIKEPETTRDLYLVPQANKGKKAELGVAIFDMKDNLLEGKLQENYMTLMGRRAMYPLYKAKGKESCLLDGTIPNCLHYGCTTQLSVDTCGKLLTPEMCLKWKERTKENSIHYNERVYCPYKNCSYLMSRTELVLGSACGHRKCLKCGCSFCFYCKAPWHSMLSCTDY
ncbi:hypothetical protein YC2023_123103 [Brassica napus]